MTEHEFYQLAKDMMPTRIAFSTTWPDRMGDLAGKPTRFPEKLITMIDPGGQNEELNDLIFQLTKDGFYDFDFKVKYIPKTTTIRSNYEYWKSKEGQLIQPFFWAGKPYRSKHVVFCPEVRLARVRKIKITHNVGHSEIQIDDEPYFEIFHHGLSEIYEYTSDLEPFTQHEGFDHPDHFWMWFDSDFEGALLEFESVEI